MANGLGDFDLSAVIYGKFVSCRADTGAPATLTSGALSVYKDNSTTQSTTGVTFSGDFDSVTGLNHFTIDTSADATFYSAGSFFDIVVTTGTVNSVSAVGSCVGQFTIRKTAALKPTVAGRALDVSTGGEAGLDWANIGSPTTANNLSATNIDVDQIVASVSGAVGSVATGGIAAASFAAGAIDNAAIATDAIGSAELAASAVTEIQSGLATSSQATAIQADTDDIQSRLPAALVSGRMDSSVGAMAANVLTAAATAADFTIEVTTGLALSSEVAAVQSDTDNIQTRIPAALIGGRIDASVGAMAANVLTAAATAADFTVEVTAGLALSSEVAAVQADTDNIQTRIPAALVGGRIDASVGAVAAGAIDAAAIANGAIDAATFAAGAIDAAAIANGAIDRATFAADTGLQTIRSNTATAGAATTITLDAGASAVDDFYNNNIIYLTGGTGAGQARFITDYVGATKVATVTTWTTNPDGTTTFAIIPFDGIPGATAPTVTQIAEGLLDWDLSVGTDSGSPTVRTVRQALRALRNKWTIVTGTYTVYKEDDATASWSSTLATTGGADPVTSSDPAGP